MNDNDVSQNSKLISSVRKQAQEYYVQLYNIGFYRQISIQLLDPKLSLSTRTFTGSLDDVYQTLGQTNLLSQIKNSLKQELAEHDDLWWPIRLLRRFVTHRDIVDKRKLFHYIRAKKKIKYISRIR